MLHSLWILMGVQQTKYLLKHRLNTMKVYRQTLKGRERQPLEFEDMCPWTHNKPRLIFKQHVIIRCMALPFVSLGFAPWNSAAHSWEDRCKSREFWRRGQRLLYFLFANSCWVPQILVSGEVSLASLRNQQRDDVSTFYHRLNQGWGTSSPRAT